MSKPLKVLDLFSGIGGFSLGLERTGGFKTVAFCEIEEFPRRVLAKHWPHVPIFHDVRELRAEHVGAVDVICGGFPCQDISTAGKGAGLAGERSGLWSEYARLVGEVRPSYVIVENVAALLGRGLGTVLGDLAALGYDAEWDCIPASAVGAPHQRDRLWIVAYPDGRPDAGRLVARGIRKAAGRSESRDAGEGQASHGKRLRFELVPSGAPLAYPSWLQPGRQEQRAIGKRALQGGQPEPVADAGGVRCGAMVAPVFGRTEGKGPTSQIADRGFIGGGRWWQSEPDVGRVAHGVPARVDRLRGLGNAVVPQIPEIIGRAILAAEAA